MKDVLCKLTDTKRIQCWLHFMRYLANLPKIYCCHRPFQLIQPGGCLLLKKVEHAGFKLCISARHSAELFHAP